MELEKTKNAKRNITFGIVYKIFSLIMPFIVRTVIIHELGMEYLGLDSLFASILQVLNLSELGLNSAITYCMYKPIAENDNKKLCELYYFYKQAYRFIGFFITAIGLILIPFLPDLISGSVPGDINIYSLYCVYLTNTSISYFLFAYKNVLLNAYQRVDVSYNIATVTKIILYGFQIIALLLSKNFYLYIIVLPFSSIVNNLLTSFWVDKYFPGIKPKGRISKKDKVKIKQQVEGVFVNRLCAISRNSFDSIIVSSCIGLSATAAYNNYFYIMNALISIMAVASNAIIGGIGNSIVLYDEEKNYQDFLKYNFLYVWLGGWFTACLFCFYQPFMQLWVGKDSMLPFSSAALFAAYFFSLVIGDMRATYSVAAGLLWENRYRSIFEALLNLILNIILGKLWGINGVLIATLLTVIFVNFMASTVILFKYYFKNEKFYEFIFRSAFYSLATITACTITMFFTSLISLGGILQLLCIGVLCLFVPNIIFLIFYGKTKDFKLSLKWLMKNIK